LFEANQYNVIYVILTLITGVLKLAMETALTGPVVRGGFKSTGLYPLDRHAIDETKLIGDSVLQRPSDEVFMDLVLECHDDTPGTHLAPTTTFTHIHSSLSCMHTHTHTHTRAHTHTRCTTL
jgi:hypothetical protein